jgi:hypothetical protein
MDGPAVVEDVFSRAELKAIQRVQRGWPAYHRAGGPMPPGYAMPQVSLPPLGPRLKFPPELLGRLDVGRYTRAMNQHSKDTTGRPRRKRPPYFRARYAERSAPLIEGIETLLLSDQLADLGKALFDARYVMPFTVYANVYLPGQGLDAHTDIPAFRGAELGQLPAWLLVAMHHSGLFERWHLPIATVIGYPTSCQGGELSYYLPAADGQPPTVVRVDPASNSAIVLDADTIFHRVEVVGGQERLLNDVDPQAYLVPQEVDWDLRRSGVPEERLGTFGYDEVRYSISWKAYCFDDDDERRVWAEHADDLSVHEVIPTLTAALAERGVLASSVDEIPGRELVGHIIDEFIPFPPPGG